MARLRVVRVEASDLVSDHGMVAPGFLFRHTTHHVVKMFEAFIARDFTLDGSSVVQLTLGERRDIDPAHIQVLGVTESYVEAFDFAAYYAMSSARGMDSRADRGSPSPYRVHARRGSGTDS